MKNIKIILSFLLSAILLFSSCSSNSENNDILDSSTKSQIMISIDDTKPTNLENSQNIQLSFNLSLLKSLCKNKKNVFYSSFSINQALTMAYFGANGTTQDEIKNALGYSGLTIEDIAAYQKYLIRTYESPSDTVFYSANSMWIDNQIIVKQSYIDTMLKNFSSDVKNLDLQGENALKTLNKWVDTKTKGMIAKLFEQPFDPLTRLVLMNAIYFEGNWNSPFDPKLTSTHAFNGINKQSSVDMMSSETAIKGYETAKYTSICLPYGEDERFQMVAVLPKGDMSNFIETIDSETLNTILTTFEIKDTPRILLPKFEMEEKLLLHDILKTIGIQAAFTIQADFSGISETNIYIDEVIHKAKIKVDEEGTEAAAVTALVMKTTSIPIDQFEFIADQPFLFFIMDSIDNTVLFTGAIYDLK